MNKENETQTEVKENEIFGYRDVKGMMLWTSNLEFAQIMAKKYGNGKIYVEKY